MLIFVNNATREWQRGAIERRGASVAADPSESSPELGDPANGQEGAIPALVGVGRIDGDFPVEDSLHVLESLPCFALD